MDNADTARFNAVGAPDDYVAAPSAPRNEETLRLLRSELTAVPASQSIVTTARTHPGRVRERNEDQYLIATLEHGLNILGTSVMGVTQRRLRAMPGLVCAVADGVGGMPGGDLASAMVIDALADCALRNLPALAADPADLLALEESIEAALRACQTRMRETATRKGLDARIATTLTLAYVQWPSMHVLHVGDSRAYLVRNGRLTQLTRDQTVAQELRDAGVDQLRAELDHVLTGAVGGESEDLRLEARVIRLEPRDVVLLCTDGLYEEVSEQTLVQQLSQVTDQGSAERAADRLVEAALHNGARDNLTAVIAVFP